jgi:hypothetical protein
MTGENSRALKVGTRVCWQNDQTDRGTVTETNWAGLTIRWDSRGDQTIQRSILCCLKWPERRFRLLRPALQVLRSGFRDISRV